MARIRSIKPEFWTSEQIVECSPHARLLFIGLWTFCDDNGIHPASCKRLKMEIFPGDDFTERDLDTMIGELLASGLVEQYSVANRDYWIVTGWAKHQKVDKPTYRHPPPNCEEKAKNSPTSPRMLADESATPRVRSRVESNGVESNGEESNHEPTLSGKPDATAVLAYLNDRTGKQFQPVKANTTLISARIAEGATLEDCKAVIDHKVAEWAADRKMAEYLRPATLFNATKFAQYAGELGSGGTASRRGGSALPIWEQ